MTDIAIVVLAAGMGTRMKSTLPKVLHKVAGRSMLGHVLSAAAALRPDRVVVVHGPDADGVKKEAQNFMPHVRFAEQTERKGTGHAVLAAQKHLADFRGITLVLYGDVPLTQTASLEKLIAKISGNHAMAVLGFHAANPHGYGRLILTHQETVIAIREELDADSDERRITLCNSGIIAITNSILWKLLPEVKPNNKKGEIYLTDLVEFCHKANHSVGLEICSEDETQGVNDRMQLSEIEAKLQTRYRKRAMEQGATLIDPATTYFSADTKIGTDVIIEPNVFFGPGVEIGNNVMIHANCHFEGAKVHDGARLGPYARLRPESEIGPKAHIGNFVEVKKTRVGAGAKANHLAYLGDGIVGDGSNIGAGTIFCNYDGFEKHLTDIGENVFVGSNSALVAPVRIGSGANIAAGSVITKDVPADALAVVRAPLEIKEGWAKAYRAVKAKRKSQKTKDNK